MFLCAWSSWGLAWRSLARVLCWGAWLRVGQSTANTRTPISATETLLGLLPCIHLPSEAKARWCSLSQAGLGLFSKPTLCSISQSHVVMALSCHRLLYDLGGVLGCFLFPLGSGTMSAGVGREPSKWRCPIQPLGCELLNWAALPIVCRPSGP